jgi:hypothetical protein
VKVVVMAAAVVVVVAVLMVWHSVVVCPDYASIKLPTTVQYLNDDREQ